MSFTSQTSPTLLLNSETCRANIRRMADKCKKLKLELNPHFKTHQSLDIAEFFREAGISKITVSSVTMAEYFADGGWSDITIALPVNIRELPRIDALAGRVHLTLDIISAETARLVSEKLQHKVSVMLEVDAGYGRTGIPANETERIQNILQYIQTSPRLDFYGFYIHAGHTYDVIGEDAVHQLHQQSLNSLNQLKENFQDTFGSFHLSLGDTPSCSMMQDFRGIDEIRPGNFVFYDLMQAGIGSCSYDDIAVVLAAPVVATEASRNEVVVHAGAIHLSKDRLKMPQEDQSLTEIFGGIVKLSKKGWSQPLSLSENYVLKLSQEHGMIQLSEREFSKVSVGDLLGILPVHSCLTADCMGSYLDENGRKINMMNWRK